MNKKTRKLFTWCLVVALVVTQMLFANVAFAATSLKGADRYQTALEVVKAGWTKSDNAVIARGDDLADALAAAPLAYAKGKAPILLTETGALPAGVLDELTALGVKNVYIVGGAGAVSPAVETALAAKFTVKRLSGADRAATALAVANEAFPTAPAKVVLVNGYAVADALSVSAIAAYNGMPILLVDKDTKSADVATYLAGKTVYAVGGEGVISAANAGTATRLSGADRYATNVAVLKAFALDYSKVFAALGEDANAVDALGGAAFAALGNNPIVLVNGALTADATAFLKDKVKADTKVYTLGGLVPASVATAIEALAPQDITVKSVSVTNALDLTVLFNKDADAVTAEAEANYEITINNGTALLTTAYTAVQDADDASKVVITLNAALHNGDIVKVKVKKAILDENLKAMTADYTVTLPAFNDTVAPSIVSAATSGNNVVVTFDDYLDDSAATVKLDGVSMAFTTTDNTVSITNGNNPALAAGTHTVVVYNMADVVGNSVNYLSKTFTISTDSTVPAFVSVKATSTMQFALTFNKALNAAPSVAVTKNGYTVNVVSVTQSLSDSKVYNVVVGNAGTVPAYATGENTTTLAVSISNIKDAANNFGAPATTSVTLVKDTVAPTVDMRNNYIQEITAAPAHSVIRVQFSEALSAVDVNKVIVTDKDGVRLNSLVAAIDDDTRFGTGTVLTLTNNAVLTAGTYTVILQAGAATDVALNDSAAVTLTVTKAATSTSTFALVGVGTLNNVITVNFGVDMTNSAITASNYKIDNASLPTGTILYFLGDKQHVVIELPTGFVATSEDYLLTMSQNIVDTNGRAVQDADKNQLVALDDNVAPTLVSAKKASTTTIELTFSEAMTDPAGAAANDDDFVVKVNGAALAVSSVDLKAGTTNVLVLTVANYNVNQGVTVTVGGTGITLDTVDANGITVKAATTVTATS